MEPRLTSIIPFWNRPTWALQEAVASLGRQGLPVRIIVIDNCSDLPVPDLPGVEVVRTPRRGSVGYARNLGLALVDTPYVQFQDADDLLVDGALAHLVDLLDAHPEAVAATGAIVRWWPEQGDRAHVERWPWRPARWLAAHAPRAFALANTMYMQAPMVNAAVFPTDVLRETGGYSDCQPGQDWMMGAALAWRGRVLCSRRPCHLSRQQSSFATITSGPRPIAEALLMRRRVRTRVRHDDGLPQMARDSLPLVTLVHWVLALWPRWR